jgi:septal ring factor EnvC (AmiA/AmiB activator)
MEVRQDFTELKQKFNSFANFLKEFHIATLDQFNGLQQLYLQSKDLQDDTWGGEYPMADKAQAALDIFMNLKNIGAYLYFEDEQNGLQLHVSLLGWVKFNLYEIIESMWMNLMEQKNSLSQYDQNNVAENNILDSLDKTQTSIERLRSSISSTITDGNSMFNDMMNFFNEFLIQSNYEYNGTSIYDAGYKKRMFHEALFVATQEPARACFRMLLKAIKDSDLVADEIAAENANYQQAVDQLEAQIAQLEAQIAQLQDDISSCVNATQEIVVNNSLISEKTSIKEQLQGKVAEEDAIINQTQAAIDALDSNSETYADDLASLQATLTKSQTFLAQATDAINQLQSELVALTAENAELSQLADELESKQELLQDTESDLQTKISDMNSQANDHNNNLSRLGYKIKNLPLMSSPWSGGGQLYTTLFDRISALDNIAMDCFNYFGYNGASDQLGNNKTTVDVPGMPEFFNSVALDYAFGEALNDLGSSWGNQMKSVFNNNQDEFKDKFQELMNRDNWIYEGTKQSSNVYSMNMDFKMLAIYEANIIKLDQEKDVVDVQLAEVLPEWSSLSDEIELLEATIKDKSEDKAALEEEIDGLYQIISIRESDIASNTEALSQAQVTKSNAQVTKGESQAIKASAEQVKDEALSNISDYQVVVIQQNGIKDQNEGYKIDSNIAKSDAEGFRDNAQSALNVAQSDKADYLANAGDNVDQTIVDGYDQTISESTYNISQANAIIAMCQNELAQYETNIAQANKNIADAQANIAQAEDTIKDASESIDEADATIAQSDAIIDESQNQIDALTATIQADTADKIAQEQSLNSSLALKNQLSVDIDEEKENLDKKEDEKKDLYEIKKDLEEFIDRYEVERSDFVSEMADISVNADDKLTIFKDSIRAFQLERKGFESTIGSMIKQSKVVKSKSNIRNN